MRRCCDFPKRAEGESALSVRQDCGCERRRCLEGQAVLGELGDSPHLFAALDGLLTAVTNLDELVPLPTCAHTIDVLGEAGKVGCFDQRGKSV